MEKKGSVIYGDKSNAGSSRERGFFPYPCGIREGLVWLRPRPR